MHLPFELPTTLPSVLVYSLFLAPLTLFRKLEKSAAHKQQGLASASQVTVISHVKLKRQRWRLSLMGDTRKTFVSSLLSNSARLFFSIGNGRL